MSPNRVPKSALPSALPSQGDSSKDGDGAAIGSQNSNDGDERSVSSDWDRLMCEIGPRWTGEKPWMLQIGARTHQCLPRHLQPPTPDCKTCWHLDYMSDDEIEGIEPGIEPGPPPHPDFEVSETEPESEEGSPESPLEPVNPKAVDLPLCAKFGLGHICQGVDCRACCRAMHGYDTPDGPIPSDPGLLWRMLTKPRLIQNENLRPLPAKDPTSLVVLWWTRPRRILRKSLVMKLRLDHFLVL